MNDDTRASRWGGVTVAGMALALPLAALREVVAAPALVPLPCDHPAVAGALPLRGVSVPVLDLGAALGRAQPGAAPYVLLVVHHGRVLGLACGGVQGIFAAEAGSRATAHAADGALPLFAGSVRRAGDGALVNLLAMDALAALPGVPWIDDPEPERELGVQDTPDHDAAAPRHRSLMLLHSGGMRFAIDAQAVHATLWQPQVEPSSLSHGSCRGVVAVGAHRAAAVDLLALAGLPPAAARPSQAVVLRSGNGLVALLVEQVVEIVRVPADDVVSALLLGLPRPALFGGLLPQPAGDHLVLDAAALAADGELAALASLHDAAAGADPAAAPPGRALITVRAPHEIALPIDQVQEVLPYGCIDGQFGADTVLRRVQVINGRAVPVVCLARLLGRSPGPVDPMAAVLVAASGDRWVGFGVSRLEAIVHADSEHTLPGQQAVATIGNAGGARTLPLLDLQALADAIVADPSRLAA